MRILIVDDDPSVREVLKLALEEEGYTDLVVAATGDEALAHLGVNGSRPVDAGVDLILMDVSMPRTNGIEATRRIKAVSELQDIPVIMVTAMNETASLKAAFEAGATDYVTKPMDFVELLARVRSSLKLKQEIDRRKLREEELMNVLTRLEEINQRLEHLSLLDGLTGVANRRLFDRTLYSEWRRAIRYGTPISLIMADIDEFKKYNDFYGHPSGDECLKRVAGAMQVNVKRAGEIVARYGGEEFAVVLPNTDMRGAAAVGEILRKAVETLEIQHGPAALHRLVTISLGVASAVPQRTDTSTELVEDADRALYQAKQAGRNRVELAREDTSNE